MLSESEIPSYAMKRFREDDREIETLAMGNCLMLLSQVGKSESDHQKLSSDRVFVCKTCNRQFSSFQALGGHRASHKRIKLSAGDLFNESQLLNSPAKRKTHECSICGIDFPIGQALGGHMRRHRNEMSDGKISYSTVPVLKKSSSKRVLCLDLDLNLTPFENDLKLQLGKMQEPPILDCFI